MLTALKTNNFRIMGIAHRYIVGPWSMTAKAFIAAVIDHFDDGHRIFQKSVTPPANCHLFHANVRLDSDSDDEQDDVYVELRLTANGCVHFRNAHTHIDPRLPK